jgi:hypothetical protein
VRKVGENEYEVSPHRTGTVPSIAAPPAPPVEELVGAGATAGAAGAEPAAEPAGRDNGQRLGLRVRRGSRGPARTAGVPLVGLVQIDAPAPAMPESAATPEPKPAKKATRPRAPRKKKAAVPMGDAAGESAEPAAPAAKRPRSRAKKKAE